MGFLDNLEKKGLDDLGLAFESEENKNLILEELNKMFATNKREHWIKILRDERRIAAPVNSMIEASNDPDIVENNYVTEVFHPDLGEKFKTHGTPWKFSETPSKIGIAPKLAEHNNEILLDLGYSIDEIKDFENKEII